MAANLRESVTCSVILSSPPFAHSSSLLCLLNRPEAVPMTEPHPRELHQGDFVVRFKLIISSSSSFGRPALWTDHLAARQTALDGLTHAPDEPPKDLDIHTPAATGAYAWHHHYMREAAPLRTASVSLSLSSVLNTVRVQASSIPGYSA